MKHYCPTGRRNHGRPLKRLLDTWDRNGSTCGSTPWQIYDDDDDDDDGGGTGGDVDGGGGGGVGGDDDGGGDGGGGDGGWSNDDDDVSGGDDGGDDYDYDDDESCLLDLLSARCISRIGWSIITHEQIYSTFPASFSKICYSFSSVIHNLVCQIIPII